MQLGLAFGFGGIWGDKNLIGFRAYLPYRQFGSSSSVDLGLGLGL